MQTAPPGKACEHAAPADIPQPTDARRPSQIRVRRSASSLGCDDATCATAVREGTCSLVVWQLSGTISEERETRALRLITLTFFALAAYLAVEDTTDLISQHRAEQSTAGIAITAAALVVMLAFAERRTGQQLGNQALITDAAESAFCAFTFTFTSAAALLGIGLNAWLGWWWATQPQPWPSRAWRSGKESKPGRPTATETYAPPERLSG
jgi:hypothetical protein